MILGLSCLEWLSSPIDIALFAFLVVLLRYETAKLAAALARLEARNAKVDNGGSPNGSHDHPA